MKHAGLAALQQLEPLLVELRRLHGLTEKRPGIFYRGTKAFLHFHEDPAGLFADMRAGVDFSRYAVNTSGERAALVAAAKRALART